ncbi:hypothetical protein ACKWTF_008188 [Chironomus riparius]
MFDDLEILEYEEYAAYSLHNFVADVGGLLGFFLGCSILSLIEIVYFTFETCASRLKYYVVAHGEQRRYKNSIKSIKDKKGLDFIIRSNKVNNQIIMFPSRLHKNMATESHY